ncbi:nucleoside triphosphate pyrophosphohydrolase [Niallia sp. XMNu-256]|uniref:nucleoside triphosphate pyrophosphohydrolase n=1 Tax=Niallia sp. XMNu-256 TaxID=3082444 RepID=UPI0030CBE93F
MAVHNKLVRDHMKQIILDAGRKPIMKTLNHEEYVTELRKKSEEELQEYLNAETNEEALEELADLLEVIHALAETHGSSIDEVEKRRVAKAESRGGFSDRVFLIEVKDD